MENQDTGLLIVKKDVQLHRTWFKEMCRLIGISVLFRSPKEHYKDWNLHGELDAKYNPPVQVGVIYDEHPNQWTMRKLGWSAEQQEDVSIVHAPYDLEGLQVGCLFIVPGGVDGSQGRVFRVIRMSTIQVYPASIACEIAPEWEDTQEPSSTRDFTGSDFNLLNEEDNFR